MTFWVHASLNFLCALIICFVPSKYLNLDELLDQKKSLVAKKLGKQKIEDTELEE